MKTTKKIMFIFAVMSMTFLASSMAMADPLPGQILKFEQKPMVGTPVDGAVYFGHDEWSTLYDSAAGAQQYSGVAMADDFADQFDTPVVHVKWWGSYAGNLVGLGVRKFLIAFESDQPVDPTNPFSHPKDVLLSQVVTLGPLAPGSGTFTETKVVPGITEEIYQYNAELKVPFNQQADTVYWLKIAALMDDPSDPTEWGWHNRDYTVTNPLASPFVIPGEFIEGVTAGGTDVWHFQDDAVSAQTAYVFNTADGTWGLDQSGYIPQHYINGVDGPGPDGTGVGGIGQFSKDLAFELYTIPEPATIGVLFLGGLLGLFRKRLRR